MNIPQITSETQLPFEIRLTRPGGPLEGLKGGRVQHGRIRARYYLSVWIGGDGTFWVMTIGHTAQTQRRRQFASRQVATEYANAWIKRTVKRGLAKHPDAHEGDGIKALSDMLMVAFKG